MTDLSVEIAGIKMQNPVMNAAGTLGLEPAGVKELVGVDKIGAFVQKSITLNPREGNPQPRILEVAAGMINRIGLQNVGVREFVDKKIDIIYGLLPDNVPLIVSVAGESVEEYLETASILEKELDERIAALEVNVSCPNVEKGLIFGTDPGLTHELVSGLRLRINLPLIVKLTPNVTDIGLIAKAAVNAGADAISLINTLKAKAYIRRGPQAGQWIEGGLSGAAIKPVALKKVEEVVKAVDVPVIGMGGIYDTDDALDFFRLGVRAVAVGTATFRDPSTMIKIVAGLGRHLEEKGYANIAEFREKEGKGLFGL
jgi:dihydroorotate dehydrogenase (NAD+) catalytic subunit